MPSRVLEWLRDFAQARRLRVASDSRGNTVIYKSGQAGGEGAPPVILQVRGGRVSEMVARVRRLPGARRGLGRRP